MTTDMPRHGRIRAWFGAGLWAVLGLLPGGVPAMAPSLHYIKRILILVSAHERVAPLPFQSLAEDAWELGLELVRRDVTSRTARTIGLKLSYRLLERVDYLFK